MCGASKFSLIACLCFPFRVIKSLRIGFFSLQSATLGWRSFPASSVYRAKDLCLSHKSLCAIFVTLDVLRTTELPVCFGGDFPLLTVPFFDVFGYLERQLNHPWWEWTKILCSLLVESNLEKIIAY